MKEGGKPGAIINIAVVPHVWQLKNFERLVINTRFSYFRYPQQLENWSTIIL